MLTLHETAAGWRLRWVFLLLSDKCSMAGAAQDAQAQLCWGGVPTACGSNLVRCSDAVIPSQQSNLSAMRPIGVQASGGTQAMWSVLTVHWAERK